MITDADVLRDWLRRTHNHPNYCGCGACQFDPMMELDIPPFGDNPGDSPSFARDHFPVHTSGDISG